MMISGLADAGIAAFNVRNFSVAEQHFEEILSVRSSYASANESWTPVQLDVDVRRMLAECSIGTDDYAEALRRTEPGLAIAHTLDHSHPKNVVAHAMCEETAAAALGFLGRSAESLLVLERALALYERGTCRSSRVGTISSLLDIATLDLDFSRSRAAIARVASLCEGSAASELGSHFIDTSLDRCAPILAKMLTAEGRYAEAVQYYRNNHTRIETRCGPDSIEAARALSLLGGGLVKVGDPAAFATLSHAVLLFESNGDRSSTSYANLHKLLGRLCCDVSDYTSAVRHLERALSLMRSHFAPDSPDFADIVSKLGTACGRAGRNADAVAYEREAATMRRRSQRNCAGPGCEQHSRPDGAPLDQCAGCMCTHYCSVACQRADWKAGHKAECKALRAREVPTPPER